MRTSLRKQAMMEGREKFLFYIFLAFEIKRKEDFLKIRAYSEVFCFIKPERINLSFCSRSHFRLLPFVLFLQFIYTVWFCAEHFLWHSVSNITFIISSLKPPERGERYKDRLRIQKRIYNSNSRYSRNKKFTFIMQIDTKCCRTKIHFLISLRNCLWERPGLTRVRLSEVGSGRFILTVKELLHAPSSL